jgi:phosphoserine phosphatase RsbU/P
MQMVLDVAQDSGFNAFVDTQTGLVTRSILCAPLQIRGTSLGGLEVINKKSADGLFSPADANLLGALAALVALAIHNARMAAALVEQERMKKELELAGEIQRGLLPPARPDSFPVHGLNVPALEVSGDFYHFFELADGRICFCLGDVSGKGMNASLLMAKTISLFHCLAKTVLQPGALLASINNEVAETASHGMFVTMVAGIYDPVQRLAVFANAGHQPPLYRDEQGTFHEFEALEPPLGILSGMDYSERTLQLGSGSLYIFTDGLTEGRLGDGSQLGDEGARDLIARLAHLPPPQRLASLVARLQGTGAALHDDVTVLVVGA